MPLLSVIIPVYNTGKYLQDAFVSILQQGIDDIEIICVNDGSTDDSLSILDCFSNQYDFIKVYSQHNQGQSAARNTGMRYATGKYIFFMDSDDVLKKDCFSKSLSYIENGVFDFIFFDGEVFCEEGIPNISWGYERTNKYEENFMYKGIPLMHSLLDNFAHRAVPWLLLIRRDYLERIHLNFYPGIIHEDELFTTLLTLQSNNIGCLKQNLVMHRVRSNSTMTSRYSRRNVDCYLVVIDEMLKWGDSHKETMDVIKKYARYTLDKVFYTAHVLPFKQKISLTKVMIQKKYTKFVSAKNWLRFIVKP